MPDKALEEVKTHPVQCRDHNGNRRSGCKCPQVVTLAAYEVYSHVFRPQPAIVTGDCRGGFGTGELIAFLYARSFPKDEWRTRVDEAMHGAKNL